jgi:hypothetical protein
MFLSSTRLAFVSSKHTTYMQVQFIVPSLYNSILMSHQAPELSMKEEKAIKSSN